MITEELAQFLESGLAIMVSTRDAELQPDGTWAWATCVHADRRRLTVFLYDEAARQMLRNLEAYPEIALAFDAPTTHRACQVKGLYVSSRPGEPAERAVVERQVDGFFAQLEAIGIPRAMTTGWTTWPCTALEVRVTQLFEQTPGPGTGEPLR
jgi:hypothetical protein